MGEQGVAENKPFVKYVFWQHGRGGGDYYDHDVAEVEEYFAQKKSPPKN